MEQLKSQFYKTDSVKILDSIAINNFGLSGFTLMSRAGLFAFETIQKKWPSLKSICVFCGIGNNGGDGFVLAKLAKKNGYNVSVIICGEEQEIKNDAKIAYDECKKYNVLIQRWPLSSHEESKQIQEKKINSIVNLYDFEIIVDALFGTGLNKELDEYWTYIINYLNKYTLAKKVAIDIPSGLNANTGIIMKAAFCADLSITFVGLKQGLFSGKARDYCGEIVFNNLQIPYQVYNEVEPSGYLLNLKKLKSKAFSNISNCAHKGDFGHVLIIGGNYGMLGACIMAAKAALRTGAGLVTVATKDEHSALLPLNTPEIMSIGINDINKIKILIEKASVILIGPGLGQDNWSQEIFSYVLNLQKPLIIDADAINLLAKMNNNYINNNCILTPHPKEASRLLNISTNEIENNRFESVEKLFEKYKANIVLKGAGTIVFGEDKKYYITHSGNYGMATAGMGDVLSGVIAGCVARGVSLLESSKIGVCVHALASDFESAKGKKGMMATDLLLWIRKLLN